MAARNYVVASVNYRFSNEARFPAAVQDVALAIRWLRVHSAAYGIDTNKFVAWGSSAGGQIRTVGNTSLSSSTESLQMNAGFRSLNPLDLPHPLSV